MLKQAARHPPAPRSALIGRQKDLAEVRDLVLRGRERLVTLTGVGGCGKTCLALGVAGEVGDAFPDGVVLVELAPLPSPQLLPEAIVYALGIHSRRGHGSALAFDRLIEYLQPRDILLILDNCEHMIDACAILADRLLSMCPKLRLLATSREPFQIAYERVYRVLSLPVPKREQATLPQEVERFPALQLFVERARAAEPAFRLTPENAALVAQVCTDVGGIPLAIELAAARVRVLSVAQIASRIGDAMRLLTGGERTAPTRQQTMKAALDWSYDLLSESEQMAFRRLFVFAGGWSLEAAEEICPGDCVAAGDVLDLLTKLVDKSLVLVENYRGVARYHMLEPVRQYGMHRLAERGESATAQAALVDYCVTLVERAQGDFLAQSRQTGFAP